MIITGKCRQNGAQLGSYLVDNQKEVNERVRVFEVKGTTSQNAKKAMLEMSLAAELTGGRLGLYHATINPDQEKDSVMTDAEYLQAIEILENEFYPEDADFQLYLSMLRSGLINTDDIIKNILSYSLNSRESVKITEIKMSEIIEKTLASFEEVIDKKHIAVLVNIEELHSFHSDAQRIQTLLNNVIDNAIKYQRTEENIKKIDIVFTSGINESTLIVTDNGIGVEKGYEERIFEMFYRGSSLSSGSGLGLYIVKQIADLLNAKIFVKTIPDGKTEFKVLFPNLKSKFRSL